MVCQIMTLCMVMATESFGYRPLLGIYLIFSQKILKKKIQIETLYMVMVTESFE